MIGVQTIDQYLPEHPFFEGLSDEAVTLISGCAVRVHFHPDTYLFREGEAADTFYILRTGRVALEIRLPNGSGLLDTVDADEVLGWSWLVPPYRWTSDARAVTHTSAVAIDGKCLRGKCEHDPALGNALLQRVVQVMASRLDSARVRLLDLYGRQS